MDYFPAKFQFKVLVNFHGCVAFLPVGVRIELKAAKPNSNVDDPQTLGQHLQKRRSQLNLHQKEAAAQMGVGPNSLLHWEKDQMKPKTRHWPDIIRFLGYDPNPPAETLAEILKTKRRQMGWSIREAGSNSGFDTGTWGRYENGEKPRNRRTLLLLRNVLDSVGS